MGFIETAIPVAEFKAKLGTWLDRLYRDDAPILITRHGRAAFVVQRLDTYTRLLSFSIEARHRLALEDALGGLPHERLPIAKK